MGFPRKGCSPLSTPPMRLPWPPASTMPVTSIGVVMERDPRRSLLREGIRVRRAIDGRREEGERQVHLVGPLPALRLEREPRAAPPAEPAVRALRGEIVAHEILALHVRHLRAPEADPGDHARRVGPAAALAVAMGAEARGKARDDLHAAAMATRDGAVSHDPLSGSCRGLPERLPGAPSPV